ncbi:hypothetical protein C8Q69DRAFT_518510 [Paecilomyces variotii]|uniref:Uncharacterized protein n=1 Tax=Byssochlamys spectabilis TaxID=264951 RepID=A0A443HXZ7_BYSSP|nr:hypothetical protein C8Q69DRAFT_518510 [Paecilomyces variotii]KAJ9229425.1 hypothetical protein DTO169E5_8881 [Paecilomyces variotii]KAJ9249345.1 hypothetical protein DTO195F2_8546 [Paecilomyces variotii]KAJ9304068.1 hypothetical protein DTO217A2_6416 [Paecilomyces variotii]KAJ9354910.1 hypothetical protein DTO280E4_6694 [Paecilomyces variotii]RWQ96705.1 hypothetical protein C8Q69DRAFT_518510 [Paecilomyces variotii]
MGSSLDHRRHRLTPSFADSAIDLDPSENRHQLSGQDSREKTLGDRLNRLALLAAKRNDISEHDSGTIGNCLDTLESLLDPRHELTREIARHRPRSSHSSPSTPAVGSRASNNSAARPGVDPAVDSSHRQLEALLKELTAVNAQLQQRRAESRHLHGLFIQKCEGLAQRILHLEDEIQNLHSDILEDTIELEGLRGTVRGLESWVGRWQRERAAKEAQDAGNKSSKKSPWKRKKHAHNIGDNENDTDTLIDGITAWMRGWKDIEEGFHVRARRRQARRDQRRQRQNDSSTTDDSSTTSQPGRESQAD